MRLPQPSSDRRASVPARGTPGAPGTNAAKEAIRLRHALLSERGAVSGACVAVPALDAYRSLDAAGLVTFFDRLESEFSADPEHVRRSAEAYGQEPSPANLVRLQRAVEAPRQELFRRLNSAPGGIALLVDMRRHLLHGLPDNPQWTGIDADLTHLLGCWFNRGLLVLRRIDWNTSPVILEKLIQYEAVHQVQGWRDLRRRLQEDRRCFAFFHPALPDEPIIFTEVALTRGMSAKVQPLLDPDATVIDPATCDCAIFYSITNCQEGLRGVSFGNVLIRQVVEDLGREFPRLKTFATLSPVPGFRTWLAGPAASENGHGRSPHIEALLAKLEVPNWCENAALSSELERDLVSLCAYYLLHAKRGHEPADPVARFHLDNGARLEQINWLGDTSAAGLRRSAGLMVNYVYRLADVERNHDAYTKQNKTVASRRLESAAKEASPLTVSAIPA